MSIFDNVIVRTLEISSPAIPIFLGRPALEPVRLSGREGLNGLFEYRLLLKTPDSLNVESSDAADFNLDAFLGREISCRIQIDGMGEFVAGNVGASVDRVGAGTREINAFIESARFVGEEGRHLQYELTLRSWLHLATLRADCRIFQDMTVVEILDALLSKYPFPVEKRLLETYAPRDYQTQMGESDMAFFERLCQEWGINYFFEHSDGAHRLVLIDNMGAYKKNSSAAYQSVEYHTPGWKTDAEYIHAFVPNSQLTSGQVSIREYDYMRPRADLGASRHDPRPTGQADSEVYQWRDGLAGSHYAQPQAGAPNATHDPHAEGRNFALLRMQALRTHGSRAKASGNLRGMVPGCSFVLTRHPRQQANAEYLVLDTELLIEDVAQSSQIKDAAAHRKQQWKVQVDFTAHPMEEPLRPAFTQPKPFSHGPEPAVVVGPPGENHWVDALGRIKVQFFWDRRGEKNQNSSCWVRVSNPWAGNQSGAMYIPRIGQEVVIDFYGGDPDQPVCTGRLANKNNLPPWALPGQAALSGVRSRELTKEGGNSAAGRSNHLILDDTAGKLQTQLKSDQQDSQLSLGHITRIDDNTGRKDARGEGFELRSDARGSLRAGEGLAISTEARPKAQAHITDMGEAVDRLAQGRELHQSLGSAAREAKAQEGGDQDDVAGALKRQNDSLRGVEAQVDPKAGRFPELQEPHLVLASAAGIESTSTQSTHLHAGEHVALSSGAHTSVSAGRSLLASARQSIRFFAYHAGMRFTAFGGDIELSALKNSIHILAQLDITQTADCITITARKQLMLNGAGSYIKLNVSGIEGGTTGAYRIHAASHSWVQPSNAPTASLNGQASLKDVEPTGRSFVLRSHAVDGRLIAFEPYVLYRNGAETAKGVTDAQGRVSVAEHATGVSSYTVRLTNSSEFELPVTAQLQNTDDRLRAQGHRAAQDAPEDRRHHQAHRRGGPARR